jgi:hypothetical protein
MEPIGIWTTSWYFQVDAMGSSYPAARRLG